MDHNEFAQEIDALLNVEFDPEHDARYAIQAYTVDFTIQGLDAYPTSLADDSLPEMIHRSSVSMRPEDGYSARAHDDIPDEFDSHHVLVDDVTLHLPPYEHGMEGEIEKLLDLRDDFLIRYGTTGLGTIMPPADWGLTPHIHLTRDSCSPERALQVIREAVNVTEQLDWMSEDEIRKAYDN